MGKCSKIHDSYKIKYKSTGEFNSANRSTSVGTNCGKRDIAEIIPAIQAVVLDLKIGLLGCKRARGLTSLLYSCIFCSDFDKKQARNHKVHENNKNKLVLFALHCILFKNIGKKATLLKQFL